jgi:hypothetical protein
LRNVSVRLRKIKLIAKEQDRLSHIDAATSPVRRDPNQHVTEAKVLIHQACIFRPEDYGDFLPGGLRHDLGRHYSRGLGPSPVTSGLGCSPHGQANAAQGSLERAMDPRPGEDSVAASRHAPGFLVYGAHGARQPQMIESHIPHRAGHRSDVPRVLGSDQHDRDVIQRTRAHRLFFLWVLAVFVRRQFCRPVKAVDRRVRVN